MDPSAARTAINDVIFRTATELLGSGLAHATLPMFCECALEVCDSTLNLAAEQYLAALAEPARHVVAQEHVSEGERIADERAGYVR